MTLFTFHVASHVIIHAHAKSYTGCSAEGEIHFVAYGDALGSHESDYLLHINSSKYLALLLNQRIQVYASEFLPALLLGELDPAD